jgi:hypothetical protein
MAPGDSKKSDVPWRAGWIRRPGTSFCVLYLLSCRVLLPQAWFSGHFHLSHDYEDSMTMSEGTAFIQVGRSTSPVFLGTGCVTTCLSHPRSCCRKNVLPAENIWARCESLRLSVLVRALRVPYVVQVGVIGEDSCRDERRQSRIVSGNDEELRVYTVNHHKGRSLMEGVARLMLRHA